MQSECQQRGSPADNKSTFYISALLTDNSKAH